MMAKSSRKQPVQERVFTLELNSGSDLRRVSVPNGNQRVLVEGTLGILNRARFVETNVLEVAGTNGVLRVDLAPEDLTKPRARRGDKQ
jgi:hypothetical protein